MLPNYTMILPVRERVDYLPRFLAHHRDYRIVVMDSSRDDHTDLFKGSANADYTWLGPTAHFPKMLRALDRVDTEFVSIGGDDDFTITDGIVACIDKLRRSPDTICVHGANVNFEERPAPNILWRNHKSLLRNYNLPRKPPCATPIARWRQTFDCQTYSPYNAVYRTTDLKKVLTIMIACGFDKPGANDYGFAFVAEMFGNYLGCGELFCLKNLEAPPVRAILKIELVDFWALLLETADRWRSSYDPDEVAALIPIQKDWIKRQARWETRLSRFTGRLAPFGLYRLLPLYRRADNELKAIYAHLHASGLVDRPA